MPETPTPAIQSKAPEAPASPPSESKPAAPPAKTVSESFYEDMDTISAEYKAKSQAKEAGKSPPKESKDTPSDTEKESVPSAKKDDTDTGGDAKKDTSADTAEKPPEKPVKAAELRTAYENLKKEHHKLKEEHEKLRTAKPPEDTEKKTLLERLEHHQKREKELEEELKFTAFERSSDYKDRFEKPFIDAFQSGRARIASLKVTDEEGNVRQGKPEDFDFIMRITDDDVAAEKASELFGAKAPMVIFHRERVQELNAARVKSIEEHRKVASEREKEMAEKTVQQKAIMEQQKTALTEAFSKLNQEAIEQYPQWFKPEEGDEKGNELLEKGFKVADLAFNGSSGMTAQELVKLHSAIRNKAGGFDRLAYKVKLQQDKIKELESELAQFKKSQPGEDSGRRGKETRALTFDEEMDQIAAKR